MVENIFEIENLTVKFDNLSLFENCSFKVPKNKTTVILGANGAGKTTVLKIIAGIIKKNKEAKIKNFSQNIFFLPQNIKYPADITLFDYVSGVYFKNNFKWFLTKSEIGEVNKILEEFKIENKKYLNLNKLSSGELQKANIALAILSEADFLLLDEATSNMDLINQIKTLSVIKELSAKITPLIIMHDINLASSWGDYFLGITKGEIIKGNRQEFFTPQNLYKIYGINFKVVNGGQNLYMQISD